MPPTKPSLKLKRVSPTAFTAEVAFPLNLTTDLYIKNAEVPFFEYKYTLSLSQSGIITIPNRPVDSYQNVYAITKDSVGNISLPTFSGVDLNSPDSILTAIKSMWYSNPALTLKFLGGLFANEIPESVDKKKLSMPYVLVRHSDKEFTFTMEDFYFEGAKIELVIFASGAFLIDECIELIRHNFDWKPLPFIKRSVKTVVLQPFSESIKSENFRSKDGNLIYRGSIMYDIIISRVL